MYYIMEHLKIEKLLISTLQVDVLKMENGGGGGGGNSGKGEAPTGFWKQLAELRILILLFYSTFRTMVTIILYVKFSF